MSFGRPRAQRAFVEPLRTRPDQARSEVFSDNQMRVNGTVGKTKSNSAYEQYKASLQAYFNGEKPLPDKIKNLLAEKNSIEAEDALENASTTTEQDSAKDTAKDSAKDKDTANQTKEVGSILSSNGKTRLRKAEDRKNPEDSGKIDPSKIYFDSIRKATTPRLAEQAIDEMRKKGFSLPLDAEILSKALNHSDEVVVAEALENLKKLLSQGGLRVSTQLLKSRVDQAALLASSSEVRSLCADVRKMLV